MLSQGGVLVRMIFYNTSMCFVVSHFAAHQKEIQQRNDDFRQIFISSEFHGAPRLTVSSHDYVFWCGDLNYRIDMDNTLCRGLINENNWPRLLEMDQLTNQHTLGRVFEDFIEGPISFPPTYKYNMYEDTYDRSEKCRVPAWTGKLSCLSPIRNNGLNHDLSFTQPPRRKLLRRNVIYCIY